MVYVSKGMDQRSDISGGNGARQYAPSFKNNIGTTTERDMMTSHPQSSASLPRSQNTSYSKEGLLSRHAQKNHTTGCNLHHRSDNRSSLNTEDRVETFLYEAPGSYPETGEKASVKISQNMSKGLSGAGTGGGTGKDRSTFAAGYF